jgi:cytochrome d ubiquinol oxidase subunit II
MDQILALLDYQALRVIWFVLLGVLFWGFALTDGFDLGVGLLLPFVAQKDSERRILINTIAPVWEGNQVWLILSAGAIFAAWPTVYAVLFTGLYLPLIGVLFAIMLRPVGFKYRSKMPSPVWRGFWDGCLFVAGLLPASSFGIVLGALLCGLPFHFNSELRLEITSPSLTHPVIVSSAILWVFLCGCHGGLYLLMKTSDVVQSRVRGIILPGLWGTNIVFCVFLSLWKTMIPKTLVLQVTDGPSNPLLKEVALYAPHVSQVLTDALPLSGSALFLWSLFVGVSLLIASFIRRGLYGWAFGFHGFLLALVIGFVGLSHFPIIIPSSTHPGHSLTVWDASSSEMSLFFMLIAALIFVPIIITYTTWVYRVMRGRVDSQWLKDNADKAY